MLLMVNKYVNKPELMRKKYIEFFEKTENYYFSPYILQTPDILEDMPIDIMFLKEYTRIIIPKISIQDAQVLRELMAEAENRQFVILRNIAMANAWFRKTAKVKQTKKEGCK